MTVRRTIGYEIRFNEVNAYHEYKEVYFAPNANRHRVSHQSADDIDDAIDEELLIQYQVRGANWSYEHIEAIENMFRLAEEKGASWGIVVVNDFGDNVQDIKTITSLENPLSEKSQRVNETEVA